MNARTTLLPLFVASACGGSPQPAPQDTTPPSPVAASAELVKPELPRAPGKVTGALDLLPTGITSFGAAVHEGNLFVLGGFYGTPHEYVPEFQSASLLKLGLDGTKTWETMPGLEAGLQSVALVSHQGALHRVGGMRIKASEDLHSVPEHARFVNGAWEPLPAMPEGRSSHDAITEGGKLYVVGGWKLTGDRGPSFYEDMWIYDEGQGWQASPSPVKRRALALATTGSHLVAIGGLGAERKPTDAVDIYDLSSKNWSQGPAFPGGAMNGFGVAAIGHEGKVFASGRDGILWSLEPGAPEWSRVTELVFPRFFHRLVVGGKGKLLAVGGIGGMHTSGRTRHIEEISLGADASESVVLWSIPTPGPAKNRQGVFLHGDTLALFGGNNSMGQHDFEPENFVSEALAIHIPSLSTSELPDFPFKRQTMQTVVAGKVGSSVGGFGTDGKVARTHPDALSFDFAKGNWAVRKGLPIARSQFGLVQHGEELWVFGGLDYDPTRKSKDQFRHLTSVLKGPVDGSSPFGETKIEMPGPRRAFGGAYHEGSYYVVGGMKGGFQLVEDCKAFGFDKKKWRDIPCPANVRLNPQLVSIGNKLVLVGGSAKIDGELTEDRSIEVFDVERESWSKLGVELPFAAKHMRAFPYRGKLLIYSAHNDDGEVHLGLVDIGG